LRYFDITLHPQQPTAYFNNITNNITVEMQTNEVGSSPAPHGESEMFYVADFGKICSFSVFFGMNHEL
jgi:hypothetical protein